MIKHIVCFKLKDNSPEVVEDTVKVMRSMEGRVPIIREMWVGADYLHSPRSYDIILEVTLDKPEDLDTYQNDPYHDGVVKKFVFERASTSVALDCVL